MGKPVVLPFQKIHYSQNLNISDILVSAVMIQIVKCELGADVRIYKTEGDSKSIYVQCSDSQAEQIQSNVDRHLSIIISRNQLLATKVISDATATYLIENGIYRPKQESAGELCPN